MEKLIIRVSLLLVLPILCLFVSQYPSPNFTSFSESDKQRLTNINKIPDDLAIRLWENYHHYSDIFYLQEIHNNMVHLGYKAVLNQWNTSIYNFYSKNGGKLPRISDTIKFPPYLNAKYNKENQTFYENVDDFLNEFFFNETKMGSNVFVINDLAEVLWIAILLERKTMFHTFYNETMEFEQKKLIYSLIKRMALFHYSAHREADKAFDAFGKPRTWEFGDYFVPEDDDLYLPAEDFLEIYESNYTNICPITENYICNTFLPLYATEGIPCYCAVIEPLDIDPQFPLDQECMKNAEFYTHQFISLTISSFIPKYLAPTNTYGLSFGELLAVALVNATSLPGKFQSELLTTNPTVIFRLHCSSLMQEFTIQFAITTRKFTTGAYEEDEQDYLFLAPKRFWEEVEEQNVLQNIEDMGIKIIRYGIVDNLTNVEEPNTESPFEYPKNHETQDECRLPETNNEFEIFHFVVFQNNCPHLYLTFWKSFLLTWFLTFGFIFIVTAGFATCFQKYRWIITFGRFKRAFRTEYAE